MTDLFPSSHDPKLPSNISNPTKDDPSVEPAKPKAEIADIRIGTTPTHRQTISFVEDLASERCDATGTENQSFELPAVEDFPVDNSWKNAPELPTGSPSVLDERLELGDAPGINNDQGIDVGLELDENLESDYSLEFDTHSKSANESVSMAEDRLPDESLPEQELNQELSVETFAVNSTESFVMRRIARKEPSFFMKVVPPVLGGLAAFPIATAIMWYGLGKDIGSTGPFVAKHVPWIVPSQLRGGPFREDGTFGGTIARRSSENTARNNRAETPAVKLKSEDSPSSSSLPIVASEESDSTRKELPKVNRSNTKVDNDAGGTSGTPVVSIRTTLLKIAEIQKEWNKTPGDREKNLGRLKAFYDDCLQLSELTGELRGNAIRAWQKDLQTFSSSILSNEAYVKAIDLCSRGDIPGISPPKLGDNIILVESFSVDKEAIGNQELSSKVVLGEVTLPIFIPEAIVKQLESTSEPRKRVLLGRVIDNESSAAILVHCCLE